MTIRRASISSTLLRLTGITALSLCASLAYADMTLDADQSTVSFISVKKSAVAESHTFKTISGSLSDDGELNISIDLASVDTNIEIRDQRLQKYLFETDKFATATLTAKLSKLGDDAIQQIETDASLDFHGVTNNVKVKATVVKSDDKVIAVSLAPVIINAANFKLEEGIAMLQKLAKLSSISSAIPVSFVLVFQKEETAKEVPEEKS